MLAHYSYGAIGGGIYALAEGVLPSRPVVEGIFAVGVWAAGYPGWRPAANILKPVTEHPIRRMVLITVAHLGSKTLTGLCVSTRRKRARAEEGLGAVGDALGRLGRAAES